MLARLAPWLDHHPATFVVLFIVAHALLWTIILVRLKQAQDVHFDIAEAYVWGQQFLWGYGKHPPLSGWIAGLWFLIFPATDWACYALAMATTGTGLLICWWISIRVVDHRRAILAVAMLALYPIFNFKGFKYNADLAQLITFPLVVLAYLNAFEKRNIWSGILLGLACALALLTKYWAITVIGAVGMSALINPARRAFIASPSPWTALGTFLVAMLPHATWLERANFQPISYAGDTYALGNRAEALHAAAAYALHNLALLAVPLVLAAAAMACSSTNLPRALICIVRPRSGHSRPGPSLEKAINIWAIQIILAAGPPIGALVCRIFIKTDWGISLFFLVPLALVALPGFHVPLSAVARLVAIWFVATSLTLVVSPLIAVETFPNTADVWSGFSDRSGLAQRLNQEWHSRFGSKWAIVAGATEVSVLMSFYSPDHPVPLEIGQKWPPRIISLAEANSVGFVGICDKTDYRFLACKEWFAANAPKAEALTVETERQFGKRAGPKNEWEVFFIAPTVDGASNSQQSSSPISILLP